MLWGKLTPKDMTQPARFDAHDPTSALLRELGVEVTLDSWLEFNGVENELDVEMLEVIPPGFAEHYAERASLRHSRPT